MQSIKSEYDFIRYLITMQKQPKEIALIKKMQQKSGVNYVANKH